MVESKLDWMQENESRFLKIERKEPQSMEISSKFDNDSIQVPVNNQNQRDKPIKNLSPKKKSTTTLDQFISQESQDSLFDKNFSQDDFKLITQRWIRENLSQAA
ncbi:MAG: hypothetical protein ACTSVU_02495 [Promethearchaeota archaeon]